ncbi:MAG: outer membrane beta-barrel protein [Verrucomicrobia bacterium]|nr:MAG: outer membrane beta-barrel protein [Verrucomicrobiota bacterium]
MPGPPLRGILSPPQTSITWIVKSASSRLKHAARLAIADSDSYALGAYLSLQATEKLKLNGRVDYGWGDDAMYYSAADAGGNAGERNKLLSLTGTADYTLWKNVISRAELRWDTCLTGDSPFGGTDAGTPTDKNAVSLTANLIYQF